MLKGYLYGCKSQGHYPIDISATPGTVMVRFHGNLIDSLLLSIVFIRAFYH